MLYENRTLYLCRHGQRLDTIKPRWYGPDDNRHDTPLSEHGKLQAALLGARLRHEPIDHIIVSPYLRALQTADAVARRLDRGFHVEPGIGEWQQRGLMSHAPDITPPDQRQALFPHMDLSYGGQITPVYPENGDAVMERLQRAIDHLLTTFDGNLLLIAHGKTVTGLSRLLTGEPENNFRHGVACLTQLVYSEDGWKVRLNGDTSHLQQSAQPV